MKLGLKVWSTNTDAYLHEARRLYAEGVYDYIELYAVPGSLAELPLWKALQSELQIQFVIHAPHSVHGVNPADAAKRAANLTIFSEVRKFADELNADKIIVHGGWYPKVADPAPAHQETSAQLQAYADSRILLENKPYLPVDDTPRRLIGSTPAEVRGILAAVGCGFCLDVGHAISSANAHDADWRAWFADFLSLRPAMFHLSDLPCDSKIDQHLHFGTGSLPIRDILAHLPSDARISIETKRNSATDLNDFQKDVEWLRS